VHIGENSVVAIRSVVSKNVECNIVVAGNPAKIVKNL
jgi:acetyltransferase-like isoleucine patch superfamily enzyme